MYMCMDLSFFQQAPWPWIPKPSRPDSDWRVYKCVRLQFSPRVFLQITQTINLIYIRRSKIHSTFHIVLVLFSLPRPRSGCPGHSEVHSIFVAFLHVPAKKKQFTYSVIDIKLWCFGGYSFFTWVPVKSH